MPAAEVGTGRLKSRDARTACASLRQLAADGRAASEGGVPSEGNAAAQVTTQHYNLLIEAWCRRGGGHALLEAERILEDDHMIPNSRSINMIIKAWVKTVGDEQMQEANEALKHVETMLVRTEHLQLANIRAYNLYLSALHLPRRTDRKIAAEHAEDTLDRMRRHGVPCLSCY